MFSYENACNKLFCEYHAIQKFLDKEGKLKFDKLSNEKLWSDDEMKEKLIELGEFAFKEAEAITGGRYREVRKMCGLDPWDYERTGE